MFSILNKDMLLQFCRGLRTVVEEEDLEMNRSEERERFLATILTNLLQSKGKSSVLVFLILLMFFFYVGWSTTHFRRVESNIKVVSMDWNGTKVQTSSKEPQLVQTFSSLEDCWMDSKDKICCRWQGRIQEKISGGVVFS